MCASARYIILPLLLLTSAALRAVWLADGNPLCTAGGDQQRPVLVTDGTGGAVIAWSDRRSTNWDNYVQRTDSAGVTSWETDGVAVYEDATDQELPRIAPDGDGGAIVTWCDARTGNEYIYAQRIGAGGPTLWASGGITVCDATGTRGDYDIVTDGAGGAIITWGDYRNFISENIYAQRVAPSGVRLWQTNGVAVCAALGYQNIPLIVTDGAGGAIIAWWDERGGNYDIYAQRIDEDGNALWTTDGVGVCTAAGDQFVHQIGSDGAGGAIIAWWDLRNGNGDIYAQRIDAGGNALWTTNGVAVSTASGGQYDPDIVTDGAGGAIVTWRDTRLGGRGIYAQRIDADGNVLWTEDGTRVSRHAASHQEPAIVSDGGGGAIVAWRDDRFDDYDIFAQRIDPNGDTQWIPTAGFVCTAAGDQTSLQMISNNAGGAIVTWRDQRDGINGDIYAARIDADGFVVTAAPGSHHTPAAATILQNHPNPFNPITTIEYHIAATTRVRLEIFDIAGRRIKLLADGPQAAGIHRITWDGRDGTGEPVDSGIYFCRLLAGGRRAAVKMVLTR